MTDPTSTPKPSGRRGATRFFLRGLAFSLPPILTLVILVWIGQGIYDYIIFPISSAVRYTIAQAVDESRPSSELESWEASPPLEFVDRRYRMTPALKSQLEQRWEAALKADPSPPPQLLLQIPRPWVEQNFTDADGQPQVYVVLGKRAVPYEHYASVAAGDAPGDLPSTATGVYMELVTRRYFKSLFHLSAVAVVVAIVLLYFIGGVISARLGAYFVSRIENGVLARVPLVSQVYSAVKQVTDFIFSETTVEYNRVVAIEYPRRGIWSMGFVTGDSMQEVVAAAGEPLISVLIPTSPMPVTGYTMSLPRREVLDLNMTIDQAFQFCVSCGVLVPPHQRVNPEQMRSQLATAGTSHLLQNAAAGQLESQSGNAQTGETGSNHG